MTFILMGTSEQAEANGWAGMLLNSSKEWLHLMVNMKLDLSSALEEV